MTNLVEELPLAATVNSDTLDSTCSNCFSSNKIVLGALPKEFDLKKCTRCRKVSYCCKDCQAADWKHHKNECRYMVRSRSCPDPVVRLISRIIGLIKRGEMPPPAFNGRKFEDLMDHVDDIMQDVDDCLAYVKNIYSELIKFMGKENVPPEKTVISYCGKYLVNAFNITDIYGLTELGTGLYIGLSVHNHSCQPNSSYHFIGSKAILRTMDSNAVYSTDLTIFYCNIFTPKKIRQNLLRHKYFFDCKCTRCLNEEEDLLEQSGMATCCPKDGYVLPRNNGKPLTCSHCGTTQALGVFHINTCNKYIEPYIDEHDSIHLKTTITNKELEKQIEMFTNLKQHMLSPYNLYLARMATLLASTTYRLYHNRALSMSFIEAREKALQRFDPYGAARTQLVMEEVMIEKEAVATSSNVTEQMARAAGAVNKLYHTVNNSYGPEHPFVIIIQDYNGRMGEILQNWKKLSNKQKLNEVNRNKLIHDLNKIPL